MRVWEEDESVTREGTWIHWPWQDERGKTTMVRLGLLVFGLGPLLGMLGILVWGLLH